MGGLDKGTSGKRPFSNESLSLRNLCMRIE